jgi:fatty acid desaturase
MPQTDANTRLDFLRAQVLTARNVKSHPLTDVVYGALNFQVEHHLFPSMPRRNLRAAQVLVRQYCAEIGVPYYETSLLQSFKELLAFLHDVGRPLRVTRAVRRLD